MRALVRTALAPVRGTPSVRAEQVSQELLGAVLDVEERSDDWLRVRGEDGYEGWVYAGGVLLRRADQADAWWDDCGGKPALCLDAVLADSEGRSLIRLPWGARVAVAASEVWLPDGRQTRLSEGRLVRWEELGSAFPRDADAVVVTAGDWLGVPYVWGGRTRWGADCSGFVQAVYRAHGFLLPRDSYQQAEVGEPVEPGADFGAVMPGDLLYFRARDSQRIVHVALSLGGAEIVHAAQANGCIARDDLLGESELERSLMGRLVAVRRTFPR